MTTTTYYNLNIVEGTDVVNPLIVDNPNYEKIDEAMHNNAVAELLSQPRLQMQRYTLSRVKIPIALLYALLQQVNGKQETQQPLTAYP